MKRSVGLTMAAVVCFVIAGASGWAAPHGSVRVAAHPPKAKAAPKHPAAKPAPHHDSHQKSKGTAKEAHKKGTAKSGDPHHEGGKSKEAHHEAGKSKETHHEVHKPDATAENAKRHENPDDPHRHRHGPGPVVNGATVVGGTGGTVVDGGTADVPAVGDAGPGSTSLSGRPQIHFSVSSTERDGYDAAAQAAGMNRAEWIRTRLNAAVGRELR